MGQRNRAYRDAEESDRLVEREKERGGGGWKRERVRVRKERKR